MAELPFPVPNPNADFPAGNAPQHSEARASTISLYGKRKLFSPLPRPILNTLGKQWKLMDDLSRTIDGDEEEFYKRFPVVITTSASTSPISKPRQTTTLTTRDIFHGWNDKALCTNALAVSLELIIDYANRWHAARTYNRACFLPAYIPVLSRFIEIDGPLHSLQTMDDIKSDYRESFLERMEH